MCQEQGEFSKPTTAKTNQESETKQYSKKSHKIHFTN